MILVDSDHLSVLTETRDARQSTLLNRLKNAGRVAVPIVVVEEHLRGWLAHIRRSNDVHRQVVPYTRLYKSLEFLKPWELVTWSATAADTFKSLGRLRILIGTEDLNIVALALEHQALLLSANLRDFEQVPGLRVEDWLR